MEMMEGADLDGDDQLRKCCCWRSTEVPIVTFVAADVTPGGHHQRSPAAGSPLQRACLFGLKLFNVMKTSV